MDIIPSRLISPTQLALFIRSPVIGAWWEEPYVIYPKRGQHPETQALDDLLYKAGHKQAHRGADRLAQVRWQAWRLPDLVFNSIGGQSIP